MQTISLAQSQYYSRPADERFPSLDALIANAQTERDHSVERRLTLKDLEVIPTDRDLTLRARGSSATPATFTHWSFGQVSTILGAPAGFLRDRVTPAIAADVLNYRISQTPAGQSVNLLARRANGGPAIVRAVTTEKYGRAWDAVLYAGIRDQIATHGSSSGGSWGLPPTWDGKPAGAYRSDRDSFLILTNGGSIVSDPSLMSGGGSGPDDRAMYRGLLVRNSEVGASSVYIDEVYYRYICGNHMLWGAVFGRRFRRRHVGQDVNFDTLREIGRIAYAWANASPARDEAIIRGLIDHEIANTKDGVIDQLRSFGFTEADATAAYLRCEQTESVSPRSFWGIAQGATRLSQDTPYQDERFTLDKLAGVVLARGAKRVAA